MIGAIFTLLVTLAFAAGPFLVPDFNGFAPERFPIPQYQPPIQPTGPTFAIWGLIYLWLIASAVFGLLQRATDEPWAKMRPPLVLSLAIGAAWLPIAQENPVLAMAMIWAMWLTAVGAMFRAPKEDRSLAAFPIGLYAGWLSAAACVATGLNLAGFGLLDPGLTALAMLGLAITVGAAIQLKLKGTPSFGLALIWALYGIYDANNAVNVEIAGLAIGGAIGLAALTLVAVILEIRAKRTRQADL